MNKSTRETVRRMEKVTVTNLCQAFHHHRIKLYRTRERDRVRERVKGVESEWGDKSLGKETDYEDG